MILRLLLGGIGLLALGETFRPVDVGLFDLSGALPGTGILLVLTWVLWLAGIVCCLQVVLHFRAAARTRRQVWQRQPPVWPAVDRRNGDRRRSDAGLPPGQPDRRKAGRRADDDQPKNGT